MSPAVAVVAALVVVAAWIAWKRWSDARQASTARGIRTVGRVRLDAPRTATLGVRSTAGRRPSTGGGRIVTSHPVTRDPAAICVVTGQRVGRCTHCNSRGRTP